MINLLEYHKINKKQSDVDFVIPFLDLDRRYFLDPALLRFSSDKMLMTWNQEIEDFLKLIHRVIKSGDIEKLKKLLSIGEAQDAGFGYCETGVSGSGVGEEISEEIIKILQSNNNFLKRGFIRLEELQWFDSSIGPDRISDLAINILKRNIISYTQQKCKKFGIPMEDVRVQKVFEPNSLEWVFMKTKMPVNFLRTVRDVMNPHPPILLFPKEIIKPLPLFLSYDEFYGFVDPEYRPGRDIRKVKSEIVRKAIENPQLSSDFIRERESHRDKLYRPEFSDIQEVVEKLRTIKSGSQAQASDYRKLVAELLDFIFEDLELYKQEKTSLLKTTRKDIVFVNNSVSGIFSTLKNKYGAGHVVVDAKNTEKVSAKDIAQVANYLNDDVGRVAFIVSRKKQKKLRSHAYDVLSKQKKVILFITDDDLKRWVTEKTRIQHTTGKHIERIDAVASISRKYSDLVTD